MSRGAYFFNKDLELLGASPPQDIRVNEAEFELGGNITGILRVRYGSWQEEAAYYGVKDEEAFLLFKIRTKRKEKGELTCEGIHLFFDDLKGCVIRDIRPQNTSARLAVERILQGTGWVLGISESTMIAGATYYHQSALSAFLDAANKWGFEFFPRVRFQDGKIVAKVVDIYEERPVDVGRWFEYGSDLISVVAESSVHELYTAFIGRGKGIAVTDEEGELSGGYSRKIKFDDIEYHATIDGVTVAKPKGQDYIEIQSATALYGYPDGTPRLGVVDFEQIEDKTALAEATFRYALKACRPKVHMKATALAGDVVLGETVRIIRDDMNIRYKTRVFRVKKDFLKEKVSSFEFGDKILLSAGERLKAQEEEKKRTNETFQSYIDNLRSEIESSYFNEDGYNYELKIGNSYGLPAGYYSFDRPIDENPTKVIYMGAGKLLIADRKRPDGAWDWKTAATGAGLVAEAIRGELGEFAHVNATQINVNSDFPTTALGKKVVIQNHPYNNVKITPEKGIQVLDQDGDERVQLGNWAWDRYGLKITDKTGRRTILDDEGILQTWQEGRCDNVAPYKPLKLYVYIPKQTKRLYTCLLRIQLEAFRAYSQTTSTTESSYTSTGSGGGEVGALQSSVETWSSYGVGHNHGIPHRTDLAGPGGRYVASFSQSGDHTHKVSIQIPNHSHNVNIPGHSHAIAPGIYEIGSRPSMAQVAINGVDVTQKLGGTLALGGTADGIDIARFIYTGRWNTIEIGTRELGRVDASVFVQALIQYGGI